MSGSYQVVLGDLQSMANTFKRESDAYRELRPQIAPPIADGGDPGLDSAIRMIMDDIDSLHTKLADRIEDHGDKLTYAHDSYQRRDVDVHGVFEDLMED